MLWLFLFNPAMGTLAYLLRDAGIAWDPLLKGPQAMVLVVAAAAWKQISYNFLFFVAGLQAIPRSLVEAAAIDGAGPGRRFRTIVFPLLAPTTFFLLVINTVYAFFDTFGIIHAVTGGGPAKATETLVYKVYNDGFVNLQLGISAAESVILMVIVIGADRGAVPLYRAAGALCVSEACRRRTSPPPIGGGWPRRRVRGSAASERSAPFHGASPFRLRPRSPSPGAPQPPSPSGAQGLADGREPAARDAARASGARHRHRHRRLPDLLHLRRLHADGAADPEAAAAAAARPAPRRELFRRAVRRRRPHRRGRASRGSS